MAAGAALHTALGSRNPARPWVLVTDDGNGQSRSAVAATRDAGRAGYGVAVSVSGRTSVAAASRHCCVRVDVPPPGSQGYADGLRAAAGVGCVAVLATSDAALLALDAPGAVLVDKAELPRRAAAAGLPVPEGWTFACAEDLLAVAGRLPYPLVVKAQHKSGRGESPAARADDAAQLAAWRGATGPLVAQRFVDAPLRAVAGVVHQGRLAAVVHQRYERTWPAVCGVAAAAVTTEPDLGLEERLPALLAGHDGIFQVQLLGPFLIDVNPRPYGSMGLASRSGVNLVDVHCRLVLGEEPGVLLRGRPGTAYRWLEGDVRNLVGRVRAGALAPTAAVRELRPRRGTAGGIGSLRDPGPALARLTYVGRQWRAR